MILIWKQILLNQEGCVITKIWTGCVINTLKTAQLFQQLQKVSAFFFLKYYYMNLLRTFCMAYVHNSNVHMSIENQATIQNRIMVHDCLYIKRT